MGAAPLPFHTRNPALPSIIEPVELVVMTALAKDSRRRFASVRAFANALEQASRPPLSDVFPQTAPARPLAAREQAANTATLYVYRGHKQAVNAVTWAGDSHRLASGSDDKTVQVWEGI
jgi:eukaryotic-like serine/threonine-protein kinase